jgi:hypothetical protein
MEYLMRIIERNSNEWHSFWTRLASTLEQTPLPTEDGKQAYCNIDGFMFMGIDDLDRAHFKDSTTRNYLFLLPDGTLEIPEGALWYGGVFAAQDGEKA